MKTLNQLRDEIHANAIEKGFYDNPREIGTLLMLIVSELAEALEADRKGQYTSFGAYNRAEKELVIEDSFGKIEFATLFNAYIKNTLEDELADTIIRVLDLCGHLNIDIERHVDMKRKYNKLREKLHGKKY